MNRQWTLARVPEQAFPQLEDFKLVETPIPTPGAGQMLTRTIYLSLDPYQWGYCRPGGPYGGKANIQPGDVLHGRTVSSVPRPLPFAPCPATTTYYHPAHPAGPSLVIVPVGA